MLSLLKNQKGVANRFLVYALGLHAGLLFAINNYGGEINKMLLEGTETTIEFTAIEAPKGFQTDTRDTGPMVETAPPKKVVEVKVEKKNTQPKEKIVAQLPKKEPVTQEVKEELVAQEAKTEPVIQEVKEELVTQEAKTEPVIQEVEEESITQEVQKEVPEVTPITEAKVVETKTSNTPAKDKGTEEGEATQTALPAVTATAIKAQSISGTTANSQGGKGKAQHSPQSDLKFGVNQGTRTVDDLRQYPGNTPPRYPKSSRLHGEKGRVLLSYYVTPEGRVTSVHIRRSSGFSRLDNAAVQAIYKYRFYPGQQGLTLHPVIFDLKGQVQQAGGLLRSSLQ